MGRNLNRDFRVIQDFENIAGIGAQRGGESDLLFTVVIEHSREGDLIFCRKEARCLQACHERLADFDPGSFDTELVRARMGSGGNAPLGEVIGIMDFGLGIALGIGLNQRQPENGGAEIGSDSHLAFVDQSASIFFHGEGLIALRHLESEGIHVPCHPSSTYRRSGCRHSSAAHSHTLFSPERDTCLSCGFGEIFLRFCRNIKNRFFRIEHFLTLNRGGIFALFFFVQEFGQGTPERVIGPHGFVTELSEEKLTGVRRIFLLDAVDRFIGHAECDLSAEGIAVAVQSPDFNFGGILRHLSLGIRGYLDLNVIFLGRNDNLGLILEELRIGHHRGFEPDIRGVGVGNGQLNQFGVTGDMNDLGIEDAVGFHGEEGMATGNIALNQNGHGAAQTCGILIENQCNALIADADGAGVFICGPDQSIGFDGHPGDFFAIGEEEEIVTGPGYLIAAGFLQLELEFGFAILCGPDFFGKNILKLIAAHLEPPGFPADFLRRREVSGAQAGLQAFQFVALDQFI